MISRQFSITKIVHNCLCVIIYIIFFFDFFFQAEDGIRDGHVTGVQTCALPISAAAMKITAKDLKDLGIVDEIIPEPDGGAHTDHEAAARLLDEVLDRQLVALSNQPIRELLDARYEKFRKMGQFFDLANS